MAEVIAVLGILLAAYLWTRLPGRLPPAVTWRPAASPPPGEATRGALPAAADFRVPAPGDTGAAGWQSADGLTPPEMARKAGQPVLARTLTARFYRERMIRARAKDPQGPLLLYYSKADGFGLHSERGELTCLVGGDYDGARGYSPAEVLHDLATGGGLIGHPDQVDWLVPYFERIVAGERVAIDEILGVARLRPTQLLLESARNAELEGVRRSLALGADPGTRDHAGRSALSLAVDAGPEGDDCALALIDAGASPESHQDHAAPAPGPYVRARRQRRHEFAAAMAERAAARLPAPSAGAPPPAAITFDPDAPPATAGSAAVSGSAAPPACQVCGSGAGGAFVLCDRCETPHHAECFAWARGCSTYGCGGESARPCA